MGGTVGPVRMWHCSAGVLTLIECTPRACVILCLSAQRKTPKEVDEADEEGVQDATRRENFFFVYVGPIPIDRFCR